MAIPFIYIIVLVIVIIAAAGGTAFAVWYRRSHAASQAAWPSPAAGPGPAAPFTVEKMVNCPDCGTPFIVRLGPAPTKIQCPRCGKTGTLPALPPRPSQQAAISAPQGSMPDQQAPVPAPRPPAPAVQIKTMACPRCRQMFTIERREGPQHITCPHCGKEGTIGKTTTAPSPTVAPPVAQAPPAPAQVQVQQTYAEPARSAPAPVPAPGTRPPAPGPRYPIPPKLITCPYCRTRFPVGDPRRPISVRCPGCGREGVLRK